MGFSNIWTKAVFISRASSQLVVTVLIGFKTQYHNDYVLMRHIWDKVFKSSRPYRLKFFKGCLPQNLLRPLLNTLSNISIL